MRFSLGRRLSALTVASDSSNEDSATTPPITMLTELPSELLTAILRLGSTQDIMSARLTCPRLRDIGSEVIWGPDSVLNAVRVKQLQEKLANREFSPSKTWLDRYQSCQVVRLRLKDDLNNYPYSPENFVETRVKEFLSHQSTLNPDISYIAPGFFWLSKDYYDEFSMWRSNEGSPQSVIRWNQGAYSERSGCQYDKERTPKIQISRIYSGKLLREGGSLQQPSDHQSSPVWHRASIQERSHEPITADHDLNTSTGIDPAVLHRRVAHHIRQIDPGDRPLQRLDVPSGDYLETIRMLSDPELRDKIGSHTVVRLVATRARQGGRLVSGARSLAPSAKEILANADLMLACSAARFTPAFDAIHTPNALESNPNSATVGVANQSDPSTSPVYKSESRFVLPPKSITGPKSAYLMHPDDHSTAISEQSHWFEAVDTTIAPGTGHPRRFFWAHKYPRQRVRQRLR